MLCHCHWQGDRTQPLTIIIVHGLEGSSESQYVRGITEKALAAGMNVVRYNQRNCGGTEELAPVLYVFKRGRKTVSRARAELHRPH